MNILSLACIEALSIKLFYLLLFQEKYINKLNKNLNVLVSVSNLGDFFGQFLNLYLQVKSQVHDKQSKLLNLLALLL